MAIATYSFLYLVTGGMAPTLTVTSLGPIGTVASESASDTGGIDSSTEVGDPIFETTGNLVVGQGAIPPFTLAAVTDNNEPVLEDAVGTKYILSNNSMPGGTFTVDNMGTYTYCFAPGTMIATPAGECAVEALAIGDTVMTAKGEEVPVKWIGRQTIRKLFNGSKIQPVCIRAGALGSGLPYSDLTVTADHGMIVDGLVINASALVNGTTIYWVPMAELPDCVTYYHIETEAHDIIRANGAPAETFVDYAGRQAFDNYAEYFDLYGCERIIPEMDRIRISAQRLVPEAIRIRLGIPAESVFNWDDLELWDVEDVA